MVMATRRSIRRANGSDFASGFGIYGPPNTYTPFGAIVKSPPDTSQPDATRG
jgi:hypothetical protein